MVNYYHYIRLIKSQFLLSEYLLLFDYNLFYKKYNRPNNLSIIH